MSVTCWYSAGVSRMTSLTCQTLGRDLEGSRKFWRVLDDLAPLSLSALLGSLHLEPGVRPINSGFLGKTKAAIYCEAVQVTSQCRLG